MNEKLLIVEDEFIVANNLRLVLENANYIVCGIAASVEEARDVIENHKIDFVLLDIYLKGELNGIDLAVELKNKNIGFIYLSANSNQQILEMAKTTEPYGFLVKPYRENDVLIALDIAQYRHKHSLESKLRKESILHAVLINISTESSTWQEKLLKMVMSFQAHIPFDYVAVGIKNNNAISIYSNSFLRIGFDEYQALGTHEFSVVSSIQQTELERLMTDFQTEKLAEVNNGKDFEVSCSHNALKKILAKTFQLKSELVFPLFLVNGDIFTFSFFSRKTNAYTSEHIPLLICTQQSISAIVDKIPVNEKSALIGTEFSPDSTKQGKTPASYSCFKDVIGSSSTLISVMDLVVQVAPFSTSILILGESGTGKERIAECIHDHSPRKSKPFIKVNCAALPSALIESELFGHEKGSFTGAIDKKIGKFELASDGTIFLDEIGELPLDQQVKLLRVLQEKEIDRIGGKQPVKVDVRIIAATNRNLEKEVAEHRFRLDLYYRLNVFPIQLPALRERKEDIKQLAYHFATKFCNKVNKPFPGISSQMIEELEVHDWPGNIRELENIIEQSIILNDGKTEIVLKRILQRSTSKDYAYNTILDDTTTKVRTLNDIKKTLQENEREYICSILKKTSGRIRGKGGAAELLNQKPTTLESRITKLGIRKEDYYK